MSIVPLREQWPVIKQECVLYAMFLFRIEQCWFCSDESVCTCLPSICLNLFPIITLVCLTWWFSILLGLTLYIYTAFLFSVTKNHYDLVWNDMNLFVYLSLFVWCDFSWLSLTLIQFKSNQIEIIFCPEIHFLNQKWRNIIFLESTVRLWQW